MICHIIMVIQQHRQKQEQQQRQDFSSIQYKWQIFSSLHWFKNKTKTKKSLLKNSIDRSFHLRNKGAWMGNFHHKALMVSASVSAYTAPALMTVCLLTDHWIYGKQTRLSTNPVVKAGDTRSYNFTYHQIGLWRECIKEKIGKNNGHWSSSSCIVVDL